MALQVFQACDNCPELANSDQADFDDDTLGGRCGACPFNADQAFYGVPLPRQPAPSLTYLPGNHDLDMWFTRPQDLFRRYVEPGDAGERVQFVINGDTYYLLEGIQVRHGHQFERIPPRRLQRHDGQEA